MIVGNAFMNGGGGLTKDLTSFVSHSGGTIDYARYVITPYTGSKSSEGVEANATHVFWGLIHFSAVVKQIVITIPESYKIAGLGYVDLPALLTGSNLMTRERFDIGAGNTTLTNTSYDSQGFIFLSFLCYK